MQPNNLGECRSGYYSTIRCVLEMGLQHHVTIVQLRVWGKEAQFCKTGRLHFRYPRFTAQIQNAETRSTGRSTYREKDGFQGFISKEICCEWVWTHIK